MRRLRSYNNFITKRGGYTKGFSTRYGNKKYQVQNDAIFPIESARQYGRNTGGRVYGRFSGGSAPGSRSTNDTSNKRFGRFGRSIHSFSPNEIIGEHVRLPWVPGDFDYNLHRAPVKVPQIRRERILPTAAGSTYSFSNLFSPKRIMKTKQARSLNRGVPTQTAEYFLGTRSNGGCGQQAYYGHSWCTATLFDNLAAGAGSSSGTKTADLWLRRASMSALYTNNTNGNVFVEVWEGYYRRSCPDDVSVLWRQGLKDQGLIGPGTIPLFPDCLYNIDPLKSKLFTQFCRVTDVKSFELGSGKSHRHTSRYYANFKYNNEMKQEYGTATNYLGGMTRFCISIFRGAPINQESSTNVSPGQVGMDMIFTMKYNYFYYTPQQYTSFTSGTFPTITNPIVVNEDTGAGVTNQAW